MNSPRCNAAQNGCTTSETIELLNAINNTPITECCNHRANPENAYREVDERAVGHGVSLRVAAYELAIERVLEAMRLRGYGGYA